MPQISPDVEASLVGGCTRWKKKAVLKAGHFPERFLMKLLRQITQANSRVLFLIDSKTQKITSVGENVGQSFEWIPHGDANARKRARAHVTRGFRREKAAQAKKEREERERRDSSSQSSSSPPQDDIWEGPSSSQTTTQTTTPPPLTPPDTTLFQPYEKAAESVPVVDLHHGLALQRNLGSGRTDPFSTLPVELGPASHALLDHCESCPHVTSVL